MRTPQLLLALVVAGAALPAEATGPAAAERRDTLTATSYQVGADRDHPLSHPLAVVVSEPYRSGARLCARYQNDVYARPNQGVVKLEVGVWRAGREVARVAFQERRTRHNRADLGCRDAPPLAVGDTLLYEFRFVNPPRLAPRTLGHGHPVFTSMTVEARVETPPVRQPSTITFLGVEPAFGSAVPAGSRIRVRAAYRCSQPLGCNLVAGFGVNGPPREEVRWVGFGTGTRTLVLTCRNDWIQDLTVSELALSIERSEHNPASTLATARADGGITCLSANPLPAGGGS